MLLISQKPTGSVTLESIFDAKYDWLLKWALHFTQGDQSAAEDLVQETCVRFIISKPAGTERDTIEPQLYTYMKYVHLSHLRRVRRYPLEQLPLIDFDSMELAIRENPMQDAIEFQDTLRRIVSFLAWRKEKSKSASVLLLRFFHGYHKEEIMRIALLSAPVVASSLMRAREDTKQCLFSGSDRIQMMGRQTPPEVLPRRIAVPHDQLLEEMRHSIMASCRSDCLSKEELLQPYHSLCPKPVSRELLAHIVSCERCLDTISKYQGLPPLRGRDYELGGIDRRTKSGLKRKAKDSDHGAKQALHLGHERLRDIYDHQPKRLLLAVNGHVIASRDVSSVTSKLEVEVSAETRMEFIEAFSEQGFCLLAMPVLAKPPEAPPELCRTASLMNGRSVEIVVRFTTGCPLLNLTYVDPSLAVFPDAAFEEEEALPSGLRVEQVVDELDVQPVKVRSVFAPWLRRLFHRLRRTSGFYMDALLVNGITFGVLSAICLTIWLLQRPPAVTTTTFLEKAIASEAGHPVAGHSGVIRQTVRIRTKKGSMDNTLYRDTQRLRVPRPPKWTAPEQDLQRQFAEAGIVWNEPLGATAYRSWHDRLEASRDRIEMTSGSLIVLRTTIPRGPVAEESLTVRASDFHPVRRTVSLRDSDTIDIAELSFDGLPWGPQMDTFFEPVPSSVSSSAAVSPPRLGMTPLFRHPPSASDLDEAELSTRLVLNDLGADRTERLNLVRLGDRVQVKGIVATEDRKQELEQRLALVPNVVSAIFTFRELEADSHPVEPVDNVVQTSAVAELTPLEQYLVDQGMTREGVGHITDELVADAAAIQQASKALQSLSKQFGREEHLSKAAQDIHNELVSRYRQQIAGALRSEEHLLALSEFARNLPGKEDDSSGDLSLSVLASKNVELCRELIGTGISSPRKAQAIVPELLGSARALLRAISSPSATREAQNQSNQPAR